MKSTLLSKIKKLNTAGYKLYLSDFFMSETITKTTDVMKAFQVAMLKNYPNPTNLGWKLITKYEAHKILKDYMSRNTFAKYANSEYEYFRSVDDKVYFEEIEKYKEGVDLVNALFENNVLKEEDHQGQKKIVLYPSSINREGKGNLHQKIKAGLFVFQSDWFRTWVDSVEFD